MTFSTLVQWFLWQSPSWYGLCTDEAVSLYSTYQAGVLTVEDPGILGDLEVRHIQPYQATKAYTCPGCHREIPPGLGHVVVVPIEAPDLRRHWHRGCWTARRT